MELIRVPFFGLTVTVTSELHQLGRHWTRHPEITALIVEAFERCWSTPVAGQSRQVPKAAMEHSCWMLLVNGLLGSTWDVYGLYMLLLLGAFNFFLAFLGGGGSPVNRRGQP